MKQDAAHPPPEDEALLSAIAKGDRSAFATVVDRYQTDIRRFARRVLRDHVEGDDVAQHVFLDFWRDRKHLRCPGSLKAHLLARTRHACLTISRSRGRATTHAIRLAEEPSSEIATPLEQVVHQEEQQALRTRAQQIALLVDTLPEEARTAVLMRFTGNASFDEIAQVLGRPAHTVRALVYRQLASLRKRLTVEAA